MRSQFCFFVSWWTCCLIEVWLTLSKHMIFRIFVIPAPELCLEYLRRENSCNICTLVQFRRSMDQLRVFKLSEHEFGILENVYRVIVSPSDVRFNYSKFCRDLQPTGPKLAVQAADLPMDASATSPLAVQVILSPQSFYLRESLLVFYHAETRTIYVFVWMHERLRPYTDEDSDFLCLRMCACVHLCRGRESLYRSSDVILFVFGCVNVSIRVEVWCIIACVRIRC